MGHQVVNLKFVFDILESQIEGYKHEFLTHGITSDEMVNKVDALRTLESTLKEFINSVPK